MRRMWSNEPERSGHVRRIGDGWACVSGANDGELAVKFD